MAGLPLKGIFLPGHCPRISIVLPQNGKRIIASHASRRCRCIHLPTDRSDLMAGRDYGVLSPSPWRLADLSTNHAFLKDCVGWGGMPLHMVEQDIAPGSLTLHADRGISMRSKSVAELLIDLQVGKSHSRPYVSEGALRVYHFDRFPYALIYAEDSTYGPANTRRRAPRPRTGLLGQSQLNQTAKRHCSALRQRFQPLGRPRNPPRLCHSPASRSLRPRPTAWEAAAAART